MLPTKVALRMNSRRRLNLTQSLCRCVRLIFMHATWTCEVSLSICFQQSMQHSPDKYITHIRRLEREVHGCRQALSRLMNVTTLPQSVCLPARTPALPLHLDTSISLPDISLEGRDLVQSTFAASQSASVIQNINLTSDQLHVDRAQGVSATSLSDTVSMPATSETSPELTNILPGLCCATAVINGQTLTFAPTEVPDPPVGLSYAQSNLDQLFTDWYHSSHLTISGHAIPIRDWPSIYQTRSGFKKNVWARLRSLYNNWKVHTAKRSFHALTFH